MNNKFLILYIFHHLQYFFQDTGGAEKTQEETFRGQIERKV